MYPTAGVTLVSLPDPLLAAFYVPASPARNRSDREPLSEMNVNPFECQDGGLDATRHVKGPVLLRLERA